MIFRDNARLGASLINNNFAWNRWAIGDAMGLPSPCHPYYEPSKSRHPKRVRGRGIVNCASLASSCETV